MYIFSQIDKASSCDCHNNKLLRAQNEKMKIIQKQFSTNNGKLFFPFLIGILFFRQTSHLVCFRFGLVEMKYSFLLDRFQFNGSRL